MQTLPVLVHRRQTGLVSSHCIIYFIFNKLLALCVYFEVLLTFFRLRLHGWHPLPEKRIVEEPVACGRDAALVLFIGSLVCSASRSGRRNVLFLVIRAVPLSGVLMIDPGSRIAVRHRDERNKGARSFRGADLHAGREYDRI